MNETLAGRSRLFLYSLLFVAALARLTLQSAAMPAYAGLDEIFHVAALVFTAEEGRAPTTDEDSISPYLEASIRQQPNALASFAHVTDRWGSVVRANPELLRVGSGPAPARPYRMRNYEAQQPQIYYRLVAPIVHLLPLRTPVAELRVWRFVSLAFALLTILATAYAGERWFGRYGILAAALLVCVPSWLTLVVRVGNDAFACAALACAFAITVAAPRRALGYVAEALLWALAVAVKLYTWPVAIVAPLLWWKQRASRLRIALVIVAAAISALLTLADLSTRTANSLGVVAFDRPGGVALSIDVNVAELVKVTIASAAWTSGQHWNALTPAGIAVVFGPLLALLAFGASRVPRESRKLWLVPAMALLSFGAAQLFNVISCVLARRAGNPVPIGGKEGWYWYVLAPVVFAIVVPPILASSRRLSVAIVGWMLALDVLIHEGALHHDYSGQSSPLHGSWLFRWGPLAAPFTATLANVAIGPFAAHLVLLRGVHVAATAALAMIVLDALRRDGNAAVSARSARR